MIVIRFIDAFFFCYSDAVYAAGINYTVMFLLVNLLLSLTSRPDSISRNISY